MHLETSSPIKGETLTYSPSRDKILIAVLVVMVIMTFLSLGIITDYEKRSGRSDLQIFELTRQIDEYELSLWAIEDAISHRDKIIESKDGLITILIDDVNACRMELIK